MTTDIGVITAALCLVFLLHFYSFICQSHPNLIEDSPPGGLRHPLPAPRNKDGFVVKPVGPPSSPRGASPAGLDMRAGFVLQPLPNDG